MTNRTARESLTILARDAASAIADDLTFALSDRARHPNLTFPFISDDRCDYNDAATDLLALIIPIICDLDDIDDASDKLLDAMRRCDLTSYSTHARCLHDLALDFNSPIFDDLPDYDTCPHRID